MPLFAKVEDNIVVELLVAKSAEWCNQYVSEGTWIETFESNTPRKHCGVNWIYHPELDNFSEPKEFESWTLDEETMNWIPPVPRPEEGFWIWDEDSLSWTEVI